MGFDDENSQGKTHKPKSFGESYKYAKSAYVLLDLKSSLKIDSLAGIETGLGSQNKMILLSSASLASWFGEVTKIDHTSFRPFSLKKAKSF